MKKFNTAKFLFRNFFIAFVIVFNTSHVFSQNYKTPKYIQFNINWLQAKSSDSCNGKMDFYGQITIILLITPTRIPCLIIFII